MESAEILSRYTDNELMAAFCARHRAVVVAWIPSGVDGQPGMMGCSYRITKSQASSPMEVEGLASYLARRAIQAVDQKAVSVAGGGSDGTR